MALGVSLTKHLSKSAPIRQIRRIWIFHNTATVPPYCSLVFLQSAWLVVSLAGTTCLSAYLSVQQLPPAPEPRILFTSKQSALVESERIYTEMGLISLKGVTTITVFPVEQEVFQGGEGD